MFFEESQTKRLFMNSSHEIRKKKESLNLRKRSLSFGLDADLGKQDEKIMFLIPFFFSKDLNELACEIELMRKSWSLMPKSF